MPRFTTAVFLGLLLLIGFGLRLAFLLAEVYHIDEYFSLLAAQMVAQKGWPILPSGLFYDHGLLFSLISGLMVALTGFNELIGRWPSLFISVLTIAGYYLAARHLFASPLAGLLAAALATFDEASILWAGRARMYALAHFFVLLTLTGLLLGFFKKPTPRQRYLFLAGLMLALLSHTVVLLMVPPLILLTVMLTLTYRREWLHQPQLGRQGVAASLMLAIVGGIVALGHLSSTISPPDPTETTTPATFLTAFFQLQFDFSSWDELAEFFQTPAYQWLLPVNGLGLLLIGYRLLRRTTTFADVAGLFLAGLTLLIMLEHVLLLSRAWQDPRYFFITVLPAYFLLTAFNMSQLLTGISRTDFSPSLIGLLLIGLMWGPLAWQTAHPTSPGGYKTAFEFVSHNWQAGDRLMTFQPAAAYLYLGQVDYYANQVTAKVITQPDESANQPAETETDLVDRYVGSPLVNSVTELNELLAQQSRLWFVVDEWRLYNRYDPFFSQQIMAQMDLVAEFGDVYVFRSRPQPVPLPADPAINLTANFSQVILLAGYSMLPVGDDRLALNLYWQPINNLPAQPFKLFVQLRDHQGQTVSQADHFVYQGRLTRDEWDRLRHQQTWLRDQAIIQLPRPLDQGPYHIYVGLYDPVSLARVPLLNDTSGENAVVIEVD